MPTYDERRWELARELGPRLARERRDRGWSLRELKDHLERVTGLVRSVSSLQRLESGEQPPRVDEWLALAQVYEVSAIGMLGQDDTLPEIEDLVHAYFDAAAARNRYHDQTQRAYEQQQSVAVELARRIAERPELRSVVDAAADRRLGPLAGQGPPLSHFLEEHLKFVSETQAYRPMRASKTKKGSDVHDD